MPSPLICGQPLDVDHAQLYEILVETLTDFVVFLIDPSGCIATWNPGVKQVLGYTDAEWIGQPAEVIFTPEDRARKIPEQELSMALQTQCARDVRWHLRKNGERLYVEGSMVALRDPSTGKVLGFSKVMRDITQRKRTEDSLRTSEAERELYLEKLARLNADLAQFAHVLSHDLKAPVRAIKSFSQLLADSYAAQLDSSGQEYLRSIQQSADSMNHLIKTLLSYALGGQEVFSPTAVPLMSVMETVVNSLQPILEETGGTVEQQELPVVSGDPVLLEQLFQNLVGNAIKYRKPEVPPRIAVRSRTHSDSWIISVSDNGQGIEPRYHEQIFAPLKRLHGAETEGTGMGLAICKRIVERHGGTIWVESEKDRGATFSFLLRSELKTTT